MAYTWPWFEPCMHVAHAWPARPTGSCGHVADGPVPAANSSLTCVNRTEDKSLPGQAGALTTLNYSRNLNFIVAIWVFVRRAGPLWACSGTPFHADTHMGGL